VCVLGFSVMENGDTAETGLSESYLAQSYAVMEGKYGLITSCISKNTSESFTLIKRVNVAP